MNKLIRKVFWASSYDLGTIEEFLEEMAEKGYMFVKRKGIFYYFKVIEPQKLKFSLDAFEKASVFAGKPEPLTAEYIEICESSGWKYCWSDGKIQVFYTNDSETVPIHTEEMGRLKTIHKNTIVNEGIIWLSFMLIFMSMLMIPLILHDLPYILIENWFGTILGLGVIIYVIADVVKYIFFYKKNCYNIKKGKAFFFYSRKMVLLYHRIRIVLLIALCCYSLIGALDASSMCLSSGKEIIPVTFEDLNIVFENLNHSSTERNEISSPFGSVGYYSEEIIDDKMDTIAYLRYEILKSPFEMIVDSYTDDAKGEILRYDNMVICIEIKGVEVNEELSKMISLKFKEIR